MRNTLARLLAPLMAATGLRFPRLCLRESSRFRRAVDRVVSCSVANVYAMSVCPTVAERATRADMERRILEGRI
jgi:hypothetical protein